MSVRIHVYECAGPPTIPPALVGQHWVDTANNLLYISVGTSAISDWILLNQSDTIITETISASSSFDLDVIPLSSLCAVKYIVCVFSAAQNKWKSFELLGSKKTATTVEDTLYSTIGANLDVDFDFIVSGTDAKLVGINNEIFDVDIRIHKNGF
jgi:hypothetical protein